jgi:hypothetical protein
MDIQEYQGFALKRTAIVPETEIKRLERDEIGVKSNLKGSEIKQYVDRAIYKIISENSKITLKAIGKEILTKATHARRFYLSPILSEGRLKISIKLIIIILESTSPIMSLMM